MMRLIKTAIASASIMVAIAAIVIVGYMSAWTPAAAADAPGGCDAYSNPYVGEPTVSNCWPRHP